jgi:hypothetical protein
MPFEIQLNKRHHNLSILNDCEKMKQPGTYSTVERQWLPSSWNPFHGDTARVFYHQAHWRIGKHPTACFLKEFKNITMKTEKRNLNIERETKENHRPPKQTPQVEVEDTLRSKKHDRKNEQIQYPAKVGYHGTDDEKDLSPEE